MLFQNAMQLLRFGVARYQMTECLRIGLCRPFDSDLSALNCYQSAEIQYS